jgi:hypothetical protein
MGVMGIFDFRLPIFDFRSAKLSTRLPILVIPSGVEESLIIRADTRIARQNVLR